MSNWEDLDLFDQAVLSCGISSFEVAVEKENGSSGFGDAAISSVSYNEDIVAGASLDVDLNECSTDVDKDLEGYYFDHNPNHKGAIRKIMRDKGESNYIIWGWDNDAPELNIWSATMSQNNDDTYTVNFKKSENHPDYTCNVHFEQNGMIYLNWSKVGKPQEPQDVENKWTKIQIPEQILKQLVCQQSYTPNMSSLGIISGAPPPAPPIAPKAPPMAPKAPPGPPGPPGATEPKQQKWHVDIKEPEKDPKDKLLEPEEKSYETSLNTLNILAKGASLKDLKRIIESSNIPLKKTAIVLDFDQTITERTNKVDEHGKAIFTIRGEQNTCDTLIELKKNDVQFAIISAQQPSLINAENLMRELNHLGEKFELHGLLNLFDIFKNENFADSKIGMIKFYETTLFRYHNVFLPSYNKPEAMRVFLNSANEVEQVYFVDDNKENALNMYKDFVKLEPHFKENSRTIIMHSYWYEPVHHEENILPESEEMFKNLHEKSKGIKVDETM